MGGQRKWLIGSVREVQGEPANCTSWSNRRRHNKWRDRTAGAGLAALLVHSKHVAITRPLKIPKSPLQLPIAVAGPLQKAKKVRVNYCPLYSYYHWFWKTPTSAESFGNWWAYRTKALLYVYPAAIVFFLLPFPILELHKAIYVGNEDTRKLSCIFMRFLFLVFWDRLPSKMYFLRVSMCYVLFPYIQVCAA